MLDALVICAVGTLAGAINALAGGGTLLTFPALVWLGRDAVVANATNALALWPGSLAGAYALRSEAAAQRKLLLALAPVSMLGGLLGGYALLVTPARLFDFLVPVLVALATLVLGLRKRLAGALPLLAAGEGFSSARILGLCCVQFVVAVYGGYFGAAMGILMLASLGLFGLSDIHERNGVKNVLGTLINGAAGLYFVARGAINLADAALLGASAVLGGYAGARLARRFASHKVERAVLVFGTIASLLLAYRVLGSLRP
jgi:uncharacterized membrane protein YfcA